MEGLHTRSSLTSRQCNVQGFDEIFGEFCTPRQVLSQSPTSEGFRTPRCTTRIVNASSDGLAVVGKKSNLSICDKCGQCEACEKRNSHRQQRTDEIVSINTKFIAQNDSAGNLQSFVPDFITQSKPKKFQAGHTHTHGRWDNVKHVTETMLKEKDMIIERQKIQRLQLEQQVRDLEEKLRSSMLSQLSTRSHSFQNQDRQLEEEERNYEKMSRSAQQLSDHSSIAKILTEKSQIERQLGEAEHTIAFMKCELLKEKADLRREISSVQSQVQEGQLQLERLRTKNDELSCEEEACQKELARLKLYLRELPTREEHSDLVERLHKKEEEFLMQEEVIHSLTEERNTKQENLSALETELKESKDQVTQLLSQVAVLENEITMWEKKEKERDLASDEDVVALREQQEQLHSDYDKLAKLLEFKQKKLDKMTEQHKAEKTELVEKFNQAEHLAEAASEECKVNEDEVNRLQEVIRQVRQESQDLMEKSLVWEDKVKAAEEITSSRAVQLEQNVVEEIVYCTSNMECLLGMFNNPDDLELTEIIATRPTPITLSSPREYVTALEQQKQALRNVNEKVENIRQVLLDKYAEDMATSGHVECTTQ